VLEVYYPSYVILGAGLILEANSAAGQSGVLVTGSTVDVKGVVIQGNSTGASFTPSGITTGDGGGASIYLSSGTISGFGGYGVLLYGSYPDYFYMRGGTISNNKTGGVQVNSNAYFNMLGGSIQDNEGDLGGGVQVNGGTFTMTEPARITGNTASDYGGGVFVENNGVFTMNSGTISNNTAVLMGGGGVKIYEIGDSRFSMAGGTISGNISKAEDGWGGGGVEVGAGTFTMSGGTISGNYADFGAGVLVQASGKFVMLGNSALITGNEPFRSSTSIPVAGVWIVPKTSTPPPYVQFVKSGGTITNDVGSQNVAVIAAYASFPTTVYRRRTATVGPLADGNLDMDSPLNWTYVLPD
jgi:hypothetical protein